MVIVNLVGTSGSGKSTVVREDFPDECHASHVTRVSMGASSFDEICTLCGATDRAGGGWGRLRLPCPGKKSRK